MKREEVWRRGGSKSGRGGGRRMTGSAFKAMDVVVAGLSYEKGRRSGGGGAQYSAAPEGSGFSWLWFLTGKSSVKKAAVSNLAPNCLTDY